MGSKSGYEKTAPAHGALIDKQFSYWLNFYDEARDKLPFFQPCADGVREIDRLSESFEEMEDKEGDYEDLARDAIQVTYLSFIQCIDLLVQGHLVPKDMQDKFSYLGRDLAEIIALLQNPNTNLGTIIDHREKMGAWLEFFGITGVSSIEEAYDEAVAARSRMTERREEKVRRRMGEGADFSDPENGAKDYRRRRTEGPTPEGAYSRSKAYNKQGRSQTAGPHRHNGSGDWDDESATLFEGDGDGEDSPEYDERSRAEIEATRMKSIERQKNIELEIQRNKGKGKGVGGWMKGQGRANRTVDDYVEEDKYANHWGTQGETSRNARGGYGGQSSRFPDRASTVPDSYFPPPSMPYPQMSPYGMPPLGQTPYGYGPTYQSLLSPQAQMFGMIAPALTPHSSEYGGIPRHIQATITNSFNTDFVDEHDIPYKPRPRKKKTNGGP